MFCQYKDILGKPNTELHSYRIFDIAIIDVLLTVIIALLIHHYFFSKKPFYYVLIGVFLVGIVVHRLFCVRTTIDKLLFN
jgi:hypothetical protein